MFETPHYAEEKTEGGELGEVYVICRQDIKWWQISYSLNPTQLLLTECCNSRIGKHLLKSVADWFKSG